MKQIINGKLYSTDTAERLAEWDNGHSVTDFGYCRESLYRKQSGEYFIAGEGGAMSKYARSCPDGMTGGDRITPITEAEAREWAETRLDADEYIAIWGEPEEDDVDRLPFC